MDSSVAKPNRPAARKLSTAELLFRSAHQMGLQPTWIVPNGLFAIVHNNVERYINSGRSPLNTHTSASLAKNKYATRLILARHSLPNIPFLKPHTLDEAVEFLGTYGTIIAKPVCGSGAHDIHIITRPVELKELRITQYILEKYVAGKEMRYLVLQGCILGVYQSEYGTSVDEHRPLQVISYPEATWDTSLVELSSRVCQVLGLRFAAVDYLITPEGSHYILEVNTTPDLKWFPAPSSGPPVDVASRFLEAFIAAAPTDDLPVLPVNTILSRQLNSLVKEPAAITGALGENVR